MRRRRVSCRAAECTRRTRFAAFGIVRPRVSPAGDAPTVDGKTIVTPISAGLHNMRRLFARVLRARTARNWGDDREWTITRFVVSDQIRWAVPVDAHEAPDPTTAVSPANRNR